jgi:hypothetical protein
VCIVPTFARFLQIPEALDFTAFQGFYGSTGRTKMTYPADCQARSRSKQKAGVCAITAFLTPAFQFITV